MKIIGLLTAWAAEDWIRISIEQAINICDEVIVCVAGYTPPLKALEDKTYEICKEYKDRITLVDFEYVGGTITEVRSMVLNTMLSQSKLYGVGNWVWMLDFDEFFSDECLSRIHWAITQEKFNRIYFNEKFFYINMQHYLKGGHYRLFRINSLGNKFKPLQAWTGPVKSTYEVPFNEGMFHYSMLTNTETHRARWKTEYETHRQEDKVKWLDEIYYKFDLTDQVKMVELNKNLFGVRSPWMNKGFKPTDSGLLFEYGGKHPTIIEQVGLPKIADFRGRYK